MQAVILAAGQGLRLGPLTEQRPKCLIEIAGKTILGRQVTALAAAGVHDPRIVIGAKGDCWSQESHDHIRRLCPDLVVNFENDRSHNVFSMYLALAALEPQDVLLLDGDLVFDDRLIHDVIASPLPNVLVTKVARSRSELGTRVVVDDQLRVIELGKSLVPAAFPWDIHSGFMKIGRPTFPEFLDLIGEDRHRTQEIESPIRDLITRTEVYAMRGAAERWTNVNTIRDLGDLDD